MKAIMKREIRAFFTSPIGYVFLTVFLAFNNLVFYFYNVKSGSSSLSSTFEYMLLSLIVLVPLLTMRLMSEEKRQRTDQMLITAPVRTIDIVVGKFFAAMAILLIGLCFTLMWALIITMFGSPALYEIIGNYIAIFAAMCAFVSVGIFLSSLTESQIIAFILCFFAMLFMYLLSTIATAVDSVVVSTVLNWFSIFSRFTHIVNGLFYLDDFVYYISFTAIFLFLTARVIDRKRWA